MEVHIMIGPGEASTHERPNGSKTRAIVLTAALSIGGTLLADRMIFDMAPDEAADTFAEYSAHSEAQRIQDELNDPRTGRQTIAVLDGHAERRDVENLRDDEIHADIYLGVADYTYEYAFVSIDTVGQVQVNYYERPRRLDINEYPGYPIDAPPEHFNDVRLWRPQCGLLSVAEDAQGPYIKFELIARHPEIEANQACREVYPS